MGLHISASAIARILQREAMSAHNVANINTEGFRAARGELGANADTAETSNAFGTPSNVNLAAERVASSFNSAALKANAAALRAQDDMVGALLDLKR